MVAKTYSLLTAFAIAFAGCAGKAPEPLDTNATYVDISKSTQLSEALKKLEKIDNKVYILNGDDFTIHPSDFHIESFDALSRYVYDTQKINVDIVKNRYLKDYPKIVESRSPEAQKPDAYIKPVALDKTFVVLLQKDVTTLVGADIIRRAAYYPWLDQDEIRECFSKHFTRRDLQDLISALNTSNWDHVVAENKQHDADRAEYVSFDNPVMLREALAKLAEITGASYNVGYNDSLVIPKSINSARFSVNTFPELQDYIEDTTDSTIRVVKNRFLKYAPQIVAVIDKQFDQFAKMQGMKLDRPMTISHFFRELEKASGKRYVVEGGNYNISADGRYIRNITDFKTHLENHGIKIAVLDNPDETTIVVNGK